MTRLPLGTRSHPRPPRTWPVFGPHAGALCAGVSIVAVALAGLLGLVWESSASAQPSDEPTPRAVAPAGPDAQPRVPPADADEVAARMGRLYPLPNRRDATVSCAGQGCLQMLNTDRVSIYEWSSTGAADRWAAATGADHAGRFGLSYGGPRQQRTIDQARVSWLELLRHEFANR